MNIDRQQTAVLLTVPQAAAYLGTTESWLREAVRMRRIASHKLGGLRRLSRADLDEYVAASREPAR